MLPRSIISIRLCSLPSPMRRRHCCRSTDVARYTHDGLKLPTTLFEAAAFHKNIRITCTVCKNHHVVQAAALWWLFHRRGWDGNFSLAVERFYCLKCTHFYGTRLKRATMSITADSPTVSLPLPDVSIGAQTGPRIGVESGPLDEDARLSQLATQGGRSPTGGASCESRSALFWGCPGGGQLRFLKRQLSLPVSTISQ